MKERNRGMPNYVFNVHHSNHIPVYSIIGTEETEMRALGILHHNPFQSRFDFS